ncbi:hypothetical protein EVG14_28680, partial [Klebsiella pneumoniae]
MWKISTVGVVPDEGKPAGAGGDGRRLPLQGAVMLVEQTIAQTQAMWKISTVGVVPDEGKPAGAGGDGRRLP